MPGVEGSAVTAALSLNWPPGLTVVAWDHVLPPSVDVTTTSRMEQCFSDPVAKQIGMTRAEQLAFRNKAFNAGETQRGDPVVPDFQAGEIEY